MLKDAQRGRGHTPRPVRPASAPAGPAALAVLPGLLQFALALAALVAVLMLRWSDATHAPFLNDDYLFLDRTRAASLWSLWGFDQLAFHWWRPWSRETHYWALQHVFGANSGPFHAVNALLWGAVLVAWWALARRIAGGAAAAWALAATAALAAWSLPLLWVAGVQDLWMLLFSLLALHAWVSGRRALALPAYVLALLSKETAALLPVVLFAYDMLLERRTPRQAFARLLPLGVVALAWAGLHPRLGGQLWHPLVLEPVADPTRLPPLAAVMRGVLAALNLDRLPAPQPGWTAIGGTALSLFGALLVLFGSLRPSRAGVALHTPRKVAMFGAAWAAVGLAPLLLPGLGFHAYYALFASFGVLLALSPVVSARSPLAVASLALLAALGVARDRTPSVDWGDAMYQRRAFGWHAMMRDDLLRKLPSPGAHSRMFFVRVPDRVGLVQGDVPALRVWYRDSTLRGGFYSAYRPRQAGEAAGTDYFFRLDSLAGWVRVQPGDEDLGAAFASNPRWLTDHQSLASAFAAAGDYRAAAAEHAKLAQAQPRRSDAAFDAAASYALAGDSAQALVWAREAARRPDAQPELVQAAREAGLLRR